MAVPQNFDGAPIEILPNPPVIADQTELVVWNSAGVEVQRLNIPVSDEAYYWDGTGANGSAVPEGAYSFGLIAYNNGEVIDESVPEVFVEIKEIRSLDNDTLVAVDGGELYPTELVRGLRPVSSTADQ